MHVFLYSPSPASVSTFAHVLNIWTKATAGKWNLDELNVRPQTGTGDYGLHQSMSCTVTMEMQQRHALEIKLAQNKSGLHSLWLISCGCDDCNLLVCAWARLDNLGLSRVSMEWALMELNYTTTTTSTTNNVLVSAVRIVSRGCTIQHPLSRPD